MDNQKRKITVAYGDGIGPEIMEAVLQILDAAGARIEKEVIEIGEKVYRSGVSSGIRPSAWDSLRTTRVFLKSPITTPQGGGYKSLNVTARKMLGLYANVRPVQTLAPYVPSKHKMDLVIVRENEEDLYAGIEYRQTTDVVECLKLISRPGCEKIVRYAFEYARTFGRKKVTCFSKDNIMKMTDGLFHRIFNEIGKEYPDIEQEHRIIDIGSALLADSPERFDVIVTLNLYGDIISDIAAEVAGSVGLCGSSNVGDACAMFEAIHGSAPDIAGKNIANPSGLLKGAIMMLVHINQSDVANKIENAWLKTLEDGIHTGDVYQEGLSTEKVGTKEFAEAVIARLGQEPTKLKAASYNSLGNEDGFTIKASPRAAVKKELRGVDIFLEKVSGADILGEALSLLDGDGLALRQMSNRGVKVWPDGFPETYLSDHWQCRYLGSTSTVDAVPVTPQSIINLLDRLNKAGFDVIKTENLYYFDGVRGYSQGQGE
ncbi:MAG: NADP-dependent isocitrate dehydrogenase [Bacteroidota bacterium]